MGVQQPDSEDQDLWPVLSKANNEEIRELRRLLWSPEDPEAGTTERSDILDQFRWLSSTTLGYLFKEKTYSEIVRQVLRLYKITFDNTDTVAELETKLVCHVLKMAQEKLSPEQRNAIDATLRELTKNQAPPKFAALMTSVGSLGALTAAQLSGFGVYMASTTALSLVTEALGLTAPFWVYTGLTSTISIVTGPVGWAATGLLTWLMLDRPNYGKLVSAVLSIASLRAKQKEQSERWDKIKRRSMVVLGATGSLVLLWLTMAHRRGPLVMPVGADMNWPMDVGLALPSLIAVLLSRWSLSRLKTSVEARRESAHALAGGLLIAVALAHVFTPLPTRWLPLGAWVIGLGFLATNSAYVYGTLFGKDIEDVPFKLRAYLGVLDLKLTKQRVFTMFLALAGIGLWSAFGTVPTTVSAAGAVVLVVLVFYVGNRVYQSAGSLVAFFTAAFLLSAACRAAVAKMIRAALG